MYPLTPPWFQWENILNCIFPIDTRNTSPTVIQTIHKELCSNKYKNFTHIYTDGSLIKPQRSFTAGVYIPSMEFTMAWKIKDSENIITGELTGILKALQFSIKSLPNTNIVIFTDSLVSLSLIRNYDISFRTLVDPIIASIVTIQNMGVEVTIQYIPSHRGIPGNEKVDTVAKEAHNLIQELDIPVPVSEEISRYRRLVWEKWKLERSAELRASRLGPLRETNQLQPLTTHLKSRNLSTSILRLRIGHCRLNSHLFRLNIENSPNCTCGAEETINHILLYCPRYYSQRVRLKHSLSNLGTSFTLKQILGPDSDSPESLKKTYRHLSVFLQSTDLVN